MQVNTTMGIAQAFDGVNDYHQTYIDLANRTFSISFWASFENENDSYSVVIGTGSVPDTKKSFTCTYSYGTRSFGCGIYGPPDDMIVYYSVPSSMNVWEWHHYAFTFDNGTKQMKLYIDGNLVDSRSSVSSVLSSTSEFWIGRPNWNSSDWFFKGSLLDVMVYNRVLSVSDINRIKDIRLNDKMINEPLPSNNCRWVDQGGMVHEYEINHDFLTWDQAKIIAESRSRGGQRGYLATVLFDAEQNCLSTFANMQNAFTGSHTGGSQNLGPYIGAKNVDGSNLFQWMVGPEKGMYVGNYVGAPGRNIGFERWAITPVLQPDIVGGANQAIHLLWPSNSEWNDVPDTWELKSIIEYTYVAP
jgi:hypothetical protein